MVYQSRIWFGEGKKGDANIPATLGFDNDMLSVITDAGQRHDWRMTDIEKYTLDGYKGYKIKVAGVVYRLYFLTPDQQLNAFTQVQRMQQMAWLKATDHLWWGTLFRNYKVKMPWFF